MQDVKESLKQTLDKLTTERDEIKVRLHLAKMDVAEDWHKLEQKWEKFSSHAKAAGHEFNIATHNVGSDLEFTGSAIGDAAHFLLEDIKQGYHEIRNKL